MSPLLGHRPSLWITHEENGPLPTTRAQCGLVGANDCECSRDQRLNVPSEPKIYYLEFLRIQDKDKFLVTHPMTDQRCLTFAIYKRSDRSAIELLIELDLKNHHHNFFILSGVGNTCFLLLFSSIISHIHTHSFYFYVILHRVYLS
jgi:hypothetical protein